MHTIKIVITLRNKRANYKRIINDIFRFIRKKIREKEKKVLFILKRKAKNLFIRKIIANCYYFD